MPTSSELQKLLTPEQIIGLNQDHLLTIKDNGELLGQKFQCHHEVLVPLAKLIRQSENDGVPLKVVSSYRSFDYQMAIWNKKFYQEVELVRKDGSTINSQDLAREDRIKAILEYSALPGTSRHHLGTDFDVFDSCAIEQGYQVQLIEQEFSEQGPCANLNDWLYDEMLAQGFFKPYAHDLGGIACEPWHISHAKTASLATNNFPIELLKTTLEASEVGGKEIILPQLEKIVEQYVLNVCPEDTVI